METGIQWYEIDSRFSENDSQYEIYFTELTNINYGSNSKMKETKNYSHQLTIENLEDFKLALAFSIAWLL